MSATHRIDTDYLIVGAGAAALAFADTLVQQCDAHITIVDRGALPGGHWNLAYPFVGLHQPSAFYGVNSLELGSGRQDTTGHNAGMWELASGPAVSHYFHQVMQRSLLPTGRVRYLPMHEFMGAGRIRCLVSGAESEVTVRRKTVDTARFSPNVPATHAPRYAVAAGARLVTPTGLALMGMQEVRAERPARYCIVGAGKTAMDVGVWLLDRGVAPEAITWVMPRDSWLINRVTTQPGMEFFEHSLGGVLKQFQALAAATSIEALFEELEAHAQMLRIDRSQRPTMFHYATTSTGEVEILRHIKHVLRHGRVNAIESDGLVFTDARVPMHPNTLYIDCSASAVEPRPTSPIFQDALIVPQLVRAPLLTFSAALIAYVEVHGSDDAAKNTLCTPVPFPHDPKGWVLSTLVGMQNQMRWAQDKGLRNWMRDTRLDGMGKLPGMVAPDDAAKIAILGGLRDTAPRAAANAQKLLAGR